MIRPVESGVARIRVLIDDADPFEADYVASVLTGRGMVAVRGADAAPLDTLQAAVISAGGSETARRELIARLDAAGIPYLTLLRVARCDAERDRPVLAPPFAAYQVADWVLSVVAGADETED